MMKDAMMKDAMMKDAMMTITKDKTPKTSIFYPPPLTDCQLQSSKKSGRRGYFALGVFA